MAKKQDLPSPGHNPHGRDYTSPRHTEKKGARVQSPDSKRAEGTEDEYEDQFGVTKEHQQGC